jgi:hypothetical protein
VGCWGWIERHDAHATAGLRAQRREYDNDTYLTYLDDSSENLSGYGYDAFGRVKNHRWKNSSGTVIAGWSHDYDRLGNKDYQEDLWDSTESELYGYDDVYRVTSFKRGQLNQEKTDITSPSRTQTWTLDPLGNWDQTVVDSTTETRVHNSVNELTARTVGEDPQISLGYDNAGQSGSRAQRANGSRAHRASPEGMQRRSRAQPHAGRRLERRPQVHVGPPEPSDGGGGEAVGELGDRGGVLVSLKGCRRKGSGGHGRGSFLRRVSADLVCVLRLQRFSNHVSLRALPLSAHTAVPGGVRTYSGSVPGHPFTTIGPSGRSGTPIQYCGPTRDGKLVRVCSSYLQ